MPTSFPIEKNHRIHHEKESFKVEKGEYQRLVRKLIYLTCIRLYLTYAVSIVSQFMCDPRERHLQVVKCVLQYLKLTPSIDMAQRIYELSWIK